MPASETANESAPARPAQWVGRLRFPYGWGAARSDLIAGATVAAIAVPQAMAYALIAGVDPRYGLYSAIVITIVASLLGSSAQLINGPTNAISLLVFSALATFAGHVDGIGALFLLGVIAGTIQILIAAFKLGDLTRYVSESVILGFMGGAGVLIVIGQIGNFIGAAKRGTGDQSVLFNTWLTLSQATFNPRACGLGVATIVVVLVLHRVIIRYRLPRVDMLAGLIVASLVAAYFGWSQPAASGKTAISVVGAIPAALPSFHVPHWDAGWFFRLINGALAIALLGLLEALAVAKSIATYTRQPLNYNRQCLAEGVGNVVGGFFQALPGSGSLTRSAINHQAGAVTRASGIYSGIIVALVVLVLGPYARFIPKSVLAGLLFITAARLIDWKRLRYAMSASRFDAALVAVTALTAIFIDVEDSILVGVALSIVLFLPRAAKPGMRELVVTDEGLVRERRPNEARQPELLIYDIEGELFFGAAPQFADYLVEIGAEAERAAVPYVVLRLKRTRDPDMVNAEHLEQFLRDQATRGITVLLAGVRPELLRILRNTGLTAWFPESQIFPEEDVVFSATLRAVRHANALAGKTRKARAAAPGTGPAKGDDLTDPAYYLV
jgi:SulP family sulfate permease